MVAVCLSSMISCKFGIVLLFSYVDDYWILIFILLRYKHVQGITLRNYSSLLNFQNSGCGDGNSDGCGGGVGYDDYGGDGVWTQILETNIYMK